MEGVFEGRALSTEMAGYTRQEVWLYDLKGRSSGQVDEMVGWTVG